MRDVEAEMDVTLWIREQHGVAITSLLKDDEERNSERTPPQHLQLESLLEPEISPEITYYLFTEKSVPRTPVTNPVYHLARAHASRQILGAKRYTQTTNQPPAPLAQSSQRHKPPQHNTSTWS